MTISSETNRNQYEGNGSTTVFPYTFKIYDEDNIQVVFTDTAGTEAILVLNTDYTVSGVEADAGGNVTYPISGDELADDEYITIIRNTPFTQLTDLKNQTAFQAETVEEAFDHAIIAIQQTQEEIDRCLKVSISSLDDPEIIDGTVAEQVVACQASATAAATSALAAEGAFKYAPLNIKTDDFTLTASNKSFLNVMNAGTAKAFTMPLIVEGHVYLIKNIGAGTLTITPAGGETTEVATLQTDESVVLTGDATNTVWRSFSAPTQDASETVKGKIEIASEAEVIAGTDALKAITPSTLKYYLVGSIIDWPLATPPTGTLECNGAAISRTTYANLFAVISTIYGNGDGSTTFNIPDRRGEFIRGWDHGKGTDPDAASRTDRGDGTGADNVGTKQDDALQGHGHSLYGATGAGSTQALNASGTASVQGNTGVTGVYYSLSSPASATPWMDNTYSNVGEGVPKISSESRPINVYTTYCIKY